MPDFDFDAFNHDENPDEYVREASVVETEPVNGEALDTVKIDEPVAVAPVVETNNGQGTPEEEVDKW